MATTQTIVQPNLFELQCYNTEINYSTTGIVGVPELIYTNFEQTLYFTGDDLQLEETQLGQMVTVSLSQNRASEILETLTLLVPRVNLPAQSLEKTIQTIAIFSQIAKSTKAQIQTYMTLCLSGQAKKVAF